MAVGDAYVFPGFLTPVLTLLFFPKPLTTFLRSFCRGERRKYAGEKRRLNWGSNSQPPGRESDTLTTEQPGRADILDLHRCPWSWDERIGLTKRNTYALSLTIQKLWPMLSLIVKFWENLTMIFDLDLERLTLTLSLPHGIYIWNMETLSLPKSYDQC